MTPEELARAKQEAGEPSDATHAEKPGGLSKEWSALSQELRRQPQDTPAEPARARSEEARPAVAPRSAKQLLPTPADISRWGGLEFHGFEGLCIGLGLLFLVIGGWFLVLSPSQGGDIVNMQRLAIGQTSAIVGAIFLAAGIRPRS
jgi:uncharacterized membrane protein